MKFKILYLLGIVILLLSCEKELNQTDPIDQQTELIDQKLITVLFNESDHWNSSAYNTAKKKHAVTKKFKVRASGTMVMIPDSPECDGYIQVNIEGEGNASHVGLFTVALSYCSDGVDPIGPIYAVQTAANGDQLFSVVVGADPSVGSLDFLYYAGTGRFYGASGFISLFFTFDYQNQTFSNYGEGTLTY